MVNQEELANAEQSQLLDNVCAETADTNNGDSSSSQTVLPLLCEESDASVISIVRHHASSQELKGA